MSTSSNNTTETTIAAVTASLGKVITDHMGVPFSIVPRDYKLESLESLLPRPSAKTNQGQNLVFVTPESFCRYVNLHKTAGTHLFATRASGQVLAVLDYHDSVLPGWGRHRATLHLQDSPEWSKLTQINRRTMTQHEYCEWLEDNRDIIVEPNSATLLELMQNLEGRNDVQFASSLRLSDGSVKLSYSEEVKVGTRSDGTVTVPVKLAAGAARYRGGQKYKINIRLRHRIENKALKFAMIIDDLDRIMDDAFDNIVTDIENQCGHKPLI